MMRYWGLGCNSTINSPLSIINSILSVLEIFPVSLEIFLPDEQVSSHLWVVERVESHSRQSGHAPHLGNCAVRVLHVSSWAGPSR